MTIPLLQAVDVTRRFGGILAVDRVHVTVHHGEIHALIGPNGAGKTTLIAQLAGELKPDCGRIHLAGRDITPLPAWRRARLGLARTFQITNIIPPMTLLENVMLAVQARRGHGYQMWAAVPRDRAMRSAAMEALDEVGLGARAECPAAHAAHGEHRRLEIAMAIATAPKLLLLDEPMAGMGASEAARMIELLGSLRGRVAMLLVEHDMEAVFALSDKVSVLVGGRVVACGAAAAIRNDPQVQRAYLGAVEGAAC